MAQWDPFLHPALPMQTFLSLYKANASLVRRLEERLSPFGLTIGRLCVIVALRRAEQPMLPSELGDDLAVTRANVSGLLNALEEQAYVRRDAHPTDKRRTLVSLTEGGLAVLEQVWPIYEGAIAEELSPLTPDEQAMLLSLLKRL